MKHWLMKTEPDVFSWNDLMSLPKQTTAWEGVRNYQARNFMRDEFKVGDQVLFYHSSCDPAGVVGVCEVDGEARPDETALLKTSDYFDEGSQKAGASRWVVVDVKAVKAFKKIATLQELRSIPELESMALLRRGQRLSVQPVTPQEFKTIVKRFT
jgi:predicted RNA-binding protein with PUA-like domain